MGRITFSRLAAAALAITLTAGTASANVRGGGYISDFVNCEAQGWAGIETVMVRYTPPGQQFGTNGAISFFGVGPFAYNFTLPPNWNSGALVDTLGIGGLGRGVFTSEPDPPLRIRVRQETGTVFGSDAGAPFHISFEIQNFNGLAGCSARGEIWVRNRFD